MKTEQQEYLEFVQDIFAKEAFLAIHGEVTQEMADKELERRDRAMEKERDRFMARDDGHDWL